jgi:hypothetical protein
MPELDRLAMDVSPYSYLDCRIPEKDTSRVESLDLSPYRGGPIGLIVT